MALRVMRDVSATIPSARRHGGQQQVASLVEEIGLAPPERGQQSQPDGEHEDAQRSQ